jgi:hypothetical protein
MTTHSTAIELEKLYMFYTPHEQTDWIDLHNETELQNNGKTKKTAFEHLVDHTIRLKDTTSCMVVGKTTSEITFKPCSKDTERWIVDESTNQIISDRHMQYLTAVPIPLLGEFVLNLQNCVINDNFQKRIFQYEKTLSKIVQKFS